MVLKFYVCNVLFTTSIFLFSNTRYHMSASIWPYSSSSVLLLNTYVLTHNWLWTWTHMYHYKWAAKHSKFSNLKQHACRANIHIYMHIYLGFTSLEITSHSVCSLIFWVVVKHRLVYYECFSTAYNSHFQKSKC